MIHLIVQGSSLPWSAFLPGPLKDDFSSPNKGNTANNVFI